MDNRQKRIIEDLGLNVSNFERGEPLKAQINDLTERIDTEVLNKILPVASDDGDSVVYDDGKWIRTRGFGYYVPTESTLLNTTTMDKDDFIQEEDLYMYVFNFSQSYLSGDTYKVTFDGDEYECVAKSQSGNIMFGNFSILDEEEEDTGEPFLFSSNSQYNQCGFIIDHEPTEDIDVKIVGNTYTPHKFDVDLLPHFIEFPSGGGNGNVLTYHTNGVSWDTLIGLPSGGLQGQYLIKTENGFGWEMPEIPEKTSDLTNDSGFIDNEVNDLEYYYKKTETYSKTEANEIISEANQAITQYCQPKNDNTLSTTAKTVVGAINEHESDISQLNEDLDDKQDVLTAGANITIADNVISATGGGGMIVKSNMDAVAVPNTEYYLGQQSTLSITMPSTANLGDKIIICFNSSTTACSLICDLTGFTFVPKANKTNKITFTCIDATSGSMKWICKTEES